MAITNPALLEGWDTNGTNQGTPDTALLTDGYPFQSIPESADINRLLKELYRAVQFQKATGVWQYDAAVSYQKHARVMRDGLVVRSLSDANQGNDPLTNLKTFWEIDDWRFQTTTHNMTSDAAYTLTADQNNFGRIIITDTGVLLTAARNILVDTKDKSFIFQNDTAQTLNVKVDGGAAAIAVTPGNFATVFADGTDVIDLSTAEFTAGINVTGTAAATDVTATNDIIAASLVRGLNVEATNSVKGYNVEATLGKFIGANAVTAWVRFDGNTGIRLSNHNVSSIVRLSAGLYEITFATPMTNANYSAVGIGSDIGLPANKGVVAAYLTATNKCTISVETVAGVYIDKDSVTVHFLGGN